MRVKVKVRVRGEGESESERNRVIGDGRVRIEGTVRVRGR